ncbi:hypothetical protein HGRIS_007428 [Hohenbuehelia grisea]|uniref:ABC transmembrane type-1 domain-containing protein n=1 Tax=Hohenbuehelia grisea TaxID=104357 RepID=A0ABR3J594_9AGAR
MAAPIYTDTLFIPTYIVGLSVVILLGHLLYLFVSPTSHQHPTSVVDNTPPVNQGFFDDVKDHVKSHGGLTIFAFKLTRFLGCINLLGLTIVSLVLDELELEDQPQSFADQSSTDSFLAILSKWGKKRRQRKKLRDQLTRHEWLLFSICMTYLYASFLSLIALTAKPLSIARTRAARLARAVPKHLNLILLVAFGVYAYRDLYPLATFSLRPRDLPPKHANMPLVVPLLWAHIAVLGVTAVVLPLCQPRTYVPFDRNNPAKEPNPEQTASILSLVLYAFLDPIIFLAYRIPHLSHDQLPPLADYDYASSLRQRSFAHLDPLGHQTATDKEAVVRSLVAKRHLFFGLMRTFWREYLILTLMLVFVVAADFASPIGINRLLNYIESHGEGAFIRPWVWISWLFVGPQIGSISMQWYIFIATGTLVRTESIITQLVFEHALRIRVLASGGSSSTEDAKPLTDEATTHAKDTTLIDIPEAAPSVPPGPDVPPSPEGHGKDSSSESSRSTLVGTLTSRIRSRFSGKSTSAPKKNAKAKKKADRKDDSGAENLHGKINNLVTTDLGNIVEARDFIWAFVYIPLKIALAVWFLYAVLGWSAFAGLFVMLVLFPVPGKVAQLMQGVQQERMKRTDARVQSVTETMNVLRMIKLFGWERKMSDRINEKRDAELVFLWKRQILELANGLINYTIPVGTMIATYAT